MKAPALSAAAVEGPSVAAAAAAGLPRDALARSLQVAAQSHETLRGVLSLSPVTARKACAGGEWSGHTAGWGGWAKESAAQHRHPHHKRLHSSLPLPSPCPHLVRQVQPVGGAGGAVAGHPHDEGGAGVTLYPDAAPARARELRGGAAGSERNE